MADTFDRGLSVPDLDAGGPAFPLPGPDSMLLIARENRLFGVLPNGSEVKLTSPSIFQDGVGLVFSPSLLDFRGTVGISAIGDVVTVQLPLVQYYETTTDANGAWSINITGMTRVDFVTPMAIDNTNTLSELSITSLRTFSNTAASGVVVESNTVPGLAGGEGLQTAEAGVRVRVRVEGI